MQVVTAGVKKALFSSTNSGVEQKTFHLKLCNVAPFTSKELLITKKKSSL